MVTKSDPGRDLCKFYNGGLKCSNMISYYFPYDNFLTFNDDLAGFTTQMKFLDIYNSNITVLQTRSFQQTPYLSHLYLRNDSLTEIEPAAFEGLKRIKLVDLSHNLIQTVPVEAFKYTKINRLSLEGNTLLKIPENGSILHASFLTSFSLKNCNIKHFSESVFGEVPALIDLDISQNLLEVLPDKIFSTLQYLSYLDLSGNRFQSLDVKIFEMIPSFPKNPHSVILSNNPWMCDCKISKLGRWATENTKIGGWSKTAKASRLRKIVECKSPDGMSWISNDFRELVSNCLHQESVF